MGYSTKRSNRHFLRATRSRSISSLNYTNMRHEFSIPALRSQPTRRWARGPDRNTTKLNDKAELEEPMARKAKVKVRPASKLAGEANRWQYETISISRSTEIAALNAMLNGLGEQGWELVSAILEDDATFLIFKRAGG
jgi:hypothetical protein